ncbi:MAG: MerR family transcriptional regulator, partial [Actinomycetota bacterium]
MTQKSSVERPYLSIGEVLGLLLEEFPDVTISKIRFLESQGLIVPERTASGYRKFYYEDVDRLRYILREQKDKYLPLRIIKDRLDTPPEGHHRRREADDGAGDNASFAALVPHGMDRMERTSSTTTCIKEWSSAWDPLRTLVVSIQCTIHAHAKP